MSCSRRSVTRFQDVLIFWKRKRIDFRLMWFSGKWSWCSEKNTRTGHAFNSHLSHTTGNEVQDTFANPYSPFVPTLSPCRNIYKRCLVNLIPCWTSEKTLDKEWCYPLKAFLSIESRPDDTHSPLEGYTFEGHGKTKREKQDPSTRSSPEFI